MWYAMPVARRISLAANMRCRMRLPAQIRFTGYIFDFYLQHRTTLTITKSLKSLIKMLETQHGIQPRVWECDNDITDRRAGVEKHLGSLHMRIEPSAPYTQAQNGALNAQGYIYNWISPYDRFHAYADQHLGMSVKENKPQQAHMKVIWNPLINKVARIRDVAFNENETFSASFDGLKDELLKSILNPAGDILGQRSQ
ncbi:hypothetical protein K449DRAFT_395987 [Hypoxylon sp. EC38]|nr:hypothetical protein K449DRAFT_395987 [Hypoxylon sp. EC38]